MSDHSIGVWYSECKAFPEMLSSISDSNLEVFQVTTDPDGDAHAAAMHSSHGHFTPDSQRFVFYRQRGTASGPGKVVLTLCEIADGFALRDLTDEDNVKSPILSLDGRWLYYFVDNSAATKPHIVLRRVGLADFRTETLLVVDSAVQGIGRVPRGGLMYDGLSISRDGKRLSTSCSFYQDADPAYASLIVDLEETSVRGFCFERYNWRPFGIYYRGTDTRYFRHLLFVNSHMRSGMTVEGKWYQEKVDNVPRATMHVLTDEGVQVGVIPIGAEGEGVDHVSAPPVACAPEDQYKGALIPCAKRVELTRYIKRPDLCHHAWDDSGTRVVCDTEGWHENGLASYLWLGAVTRGPDGAPRVVPRYLLHPQSSWKGSYWTQCQPALSPDCRTIFFNSDYICKPGHPQLFAVRGFTFPKE